MELAQKKIYFRDPALRDTVVSQFSFGLQLVRIRRIMRSEQEMYELIVNTARNDDRIRAVIMNGSRANPKAPRDIFQDYDIVYIVMEVSSLNAKEMY